jgi:NADH-quinone oxidoreductase subunit N
LVFLVAGIAFKIGAAPFHMWLPDVYHGAPAAMTLFVGAAPKIAAFALALRILAFALPDLSADWETMLAVLAVASLAIGNITAIAQTNFKRMLAYSAIAHSGFLLLGILPASASGYAGAMFYIIIYALSALGGFGMITLLSARQSERDMDDLNDLRGLAGRGGFCALVILILMFSMAGVPPVAGFYAKLAVLEALVAADFVWLAVAAVVLSVIGAFYYLRVVKLMFFDKPAANAKPLSLPPGALVLAGINGALILGLGLFPDALLSLCERAVRLSLF